MLARQNEQQGSVPRLRVLAAAVDEFARHGFANARIRSIVDAAHANVAAVNYYFGGKDGLYRATLMSLAVRMEPLDVTKVSSLRSAAERLDKCVKLLLRRFSAADGPTPLARILAHEALAESGQLATVLQESLGAELALLRAILREVAGADASEEALLRLSVGVLGQCVLHLHAALSVDQETRELLALQIAESALREAHRLQRAPVAEK